MADSGTPTPNDDLNELEAAARSAIEDGDWEPHFNTHGDPFVTEVGRGHFGLVATISTAPSDYGQARAKFIALANPVNVLALVARLRQAEAEIACAPSMQDVAELVAAETADLTAALATAEAVCEALERVDAALLSDVGLCEAFWAWRSSRPVAAGVAVPEAPRDEDDLYLTSLRQIGASDEVMDAARATRTVDNFVPTERAVPEATTEPKP